MELPVADLTQHWVELKLGAQSRFLMPDFASAQTLSDGSLRFDPQASGPAGGLALMDGESDHGGERHLDGDELILVMDGRLTIVLLNEDGSERLRTSLGAEQAALIPRGIWHRLLADGRCRFLFMGGGRTEIRRS